MARPRIRFARCALELDRIDIEVPAYLAGAQAVKRLRPLTEKPLQCAPRERLRKHLRPLAARDPREAHRHRVEQRDVVLPSGCGGERPGGTVPAGGHYVTPCIVEAENTWAIVQQETFAPILYAMKYRSIEEAIALQNGVPQGLSSAIFTNDMREA